MLDNYSRQLSVFQPLRFDKTVDVIGAGATGSHLVYILAKMGVQKIRVFDFDVIEDHNLPNQMFRVTDIGRPKVEALAEVIKQFTNIDIEPVNLRVEAGIDYLPANIVFILTDTMASRKEIFDNFLKLQFGVNLVIETRMGADNGRVYAFSPTIIAQIAEWEKTLYDDKVAEVSLCGTSVSVAATALNVASLAVWQMLVFAKGEKPVFETIYGIVPLVSLNRP